MAILDAEYWFSLREFSLFLQATEQRSHLGEDRYRVACIGFVAVEGDAVIFEINVFAAEARTLRCSNACLTHKLNQVRRGVVIELHNVSLVFDFVAEFVAPEVFHYGEELFPSWRLADWGFAL